MLICREPSTPEVTSLAALMADVLPRDADGIHLDLAPGATLPEGVTPAARPDLYPAAQWVTRTYCRCWPDLCVGRREP